MMGLMPSHENTAALLASYIVQGKSSELGLDNNNNNNDNTNNKW